MATISWGVVIDLTDHTSATDTDIGLYSGVFYWITGRPGYSGSGYSGEAPASKTWKQGIITDVNQISPLIRIVKGMRKTGGYGSLSGVTIALDDSAGLNNDLEGNDYFVINRPFDIYCFIDDVSYQVWGGIVSEKMKEGSVLKFKGEDDFKTIHKIIPPNVINEVEFPDADSKSIGATIPITFGNCLRSKVIPVTGKIEEEILHLPSVFPPGTDIRLLGSTVAASTTMDTASDDYRLNLKTPFMDFPADYFIDNGVFYLRAIKGISEQSIRILGNEATTDPNTSDAKTKILISNFFSGVDSVAAFNANNVYIGTTLPDDLALFQILKMSVEYLVSNGAISSYILDSQNKTTIARWNKDRAEYDSIDELLESTDATIATGHPNVSIQNNDIDLSGALTRLIPITPSGIDFVSHDYTGSITHPTTGNSLAASKDNLIDRSRVTTANLFTTGLQTVINIIYKLEFPADLPLTDFDALYTTFDLDVSEVVQGSVLLSWTLSSYGPYGDRLYTNNTANVHPSSLTVNPKLNINYLPNEYYLGGGSDNAQTSRWGTIDTSVDLNGLFLMNENIISNFNDMVANRFVQVKLTFTFPGPATPSIFLKQIGFMGSQSINTIQDDNFVKIYGETV